MIWPKVIPEKRLGSAARAANMPAHEVKTIVMIPVELVSNSVFEAEKTYHPRPMPRLFVEVATASRVLPRRF
jgi:hypothetical protein